MTTCGHAELRADPEVEGWENPTEPVQVILRCPDCKMNARVVIEDVALLSWTTDHYGDPDHDHDAGCCPEHGTHSMPHKGCILR